MPLCPNNDFIAYQIFSVISLDNASATNAGGLWFLKQVARKFTLNIGNIDNFD